MKASTTFEKIKLTYEELGEINRIKYIVGFDDAVIGIEENDMRLVYSKEKMIEILMQENQWDRVDAMDFFSFNIANVNIGEGTPIICIDDFLI